ncbi:MAG: cupin domain-containing protein [Gammaproteobacteria bacterium]
MSYSATAEELLNTQTSWDDGNIYYPQGQAEITSHKLRIGEGQKIKFHCHPVPTMFYVLKGELEVETKEGKKMKIKEGESAVEVMRTLHRGHEINGPVEIIVFYAGSTSMPNTVLPADDLDNKYCKD